jgi:hypothetical protein
VWTRKFWLDASERAVKTFAQTLVAAMAVGGINLLSVGWKQALTTAGFATALSVLSSVATAQASTGQPDSASLVVNVAEPTTPALVAPKE